MLNIIKRTAIPFCAGIVFTILCFIFTNAAMKEVSKSEYCGGKCHEMNQAYRSWELSPHGSNKYGYRVDCIKCNLPPREGDCIVHISAGVYKAGRDIYKHYFSGKYDIEKMRKKVLKDMSNSQCTHCHNDLLTKPDSPLAQQAHLAALANPDNPENRCVRCHEFTGHQR